MKCLFIFNSLGTLGKWVNILFATDRVGGFQSKHHIGACRGD